MCSAERTFVRQRHQGMSLSGMPPIVEERVPRREDFSVLCTVHDRTCSRLHTLCSPDGDPAFRCVHPGVATNAESSHSMSDWRTRRAVPFASAMAGVALLAGCGTLPGGTGGTTGPIVVMTWAPEDTNATNMPGMPAMAKTFAKYVNARGGIAGRELKVVTCNDHNSALGAGDCAQRAADEGAVAVVGSYSQFGAAFTSTLE